MRPTATAVVVERLTPHRWRDERAGRSGSLLAQWPDTRFQVVDFSVRFGPTMVLPIHLHPFVLAAWRF